MSTFREMEDKVMDAIFGFDRRLKEAEEREAEAREQAAEELGEAVEETSVLLDRLGGVSPTDLRGTPKGDELLAQAKAGEDVAAEVREFLKVREDLGL